MLRFVLLFACVILSAGACSSRGVDEATELPPTRTFTSPDTATATVQPTETATMTPAPTFTPTPTSTPTRTPLPTRTASPTPSSTPTTTPAPTPLSFRVPDISHNGISFNADPALGELVFVHELSEALDYIEFTFAPDGFCREVGCVTVYSVQSYREGIPGGDSIIDGLEAVIEIQSLDYFPTVGAAILLRAQTRHTSFQNGRGIRAIVMRGQDGYFANNEAVVYDFHGLTSDGQYYVVVTFPIDASILLSTYDPDENTNEAVIPVLELPSDVQQLYEAILEYNNQVQQQLEGLDASNFAPDLALLDGLVTSLLVLPPPEE